MQNTKGFEQHELDIINEVRLGLIADGMQDSEAIQLILRTWRSEIQGADDLRRAFFSVARRSASRKVGLLERGNYLVNFDWRASYP